MTRQYGQWGKMTEISLIGEDPYAEIVFSTVYGVTTG